jgi:hypothetical protein
MRENSTHLIPLICEELEWQTQIAFELNMRLHIIAADAQNCHQGHSSSDHVGSAVLTLQKADYLERW